MDVLDFLHAWGAENVQPVPSGHKISEATRLAALCIAAAASQNISEEDLEAAAGVDVISYMSDLIDNAALAEFDRISKTGD